MVKTPLEPAVKLFFALVLEKNSGDNDAAMTISVVVNRHFAIISSNVYARRANNRMNKWRLSTRR